MAQFDSIEISEDMLESISGGKLDEVSRNNLKGIVTIFKQSGHTLDETIKALSYLQTTDDWDEILQLINEYYAAAKDAVRKHVTQE